MFDIIKKYKNIRLYYLLAITCIIIDVILGSTVLKGIVMLDVSMKQTTSVTGATGLSGGGGILLALILIIVITFAIFKVPNTKYDTIWQWIKTLLIVIIPFWFVFYLMFFDMISNTGSDVKPFIFLLYELLSVLAIVFTLMARANYRKTDEFISKQNVKNEKREDAESEARRKYIEKEEKEQQKLQEKEERIHKAWEDYNKELINRGIHCYSVAFVPHKKFMSGIIVPRFYVEAIDKDSAVSAARKKLPNEAKHQTVTECVAIAGIKSLSYTEVENKWKDRYLGNKEVVR